MSLQTQDITTLLRNQAAAIQAKAAQFVNFTVGSVLRAIIESNAAIVLWLQSLILQVLSTTRAATSIGVDLDSFVADYGMTRLPAVASTGTVTFSRFTATLQAIINVGATVQTADGLQVFTVISDTTQPIWNAASGAYIIAPGISSGNVTVRAVTVGTGGNVAAAAINTLGSSIPGIDTVTNALAFIGGLDIETDAAVRLRFTNYLSSLSKATLIAVGAAIQSVQSGVVYTLTENQDYNGTADNGYFYAVVDDGTGSPTSGFLSSVYNAVDATRPIGTRFGVFGPVTLTIPVSAVITTAAGYAHSSVVAIAQTAVQSYIKSINLGQTLFVTRVAQVIYDSSPGITSVTGLTINGGTIDVTATTKQVIRPGTISIT